MSPRARKTSKPTELDAAVRRLTRMSACREALSWLLSLPPDTTPTLAWETCPTGDWLVWLVVELFWLRKLGTRSQMLLAMCAGAWPACGEADRPVVLGVIEYARALGRPTAHDEAPPLLAELKAELSRDRAKLAERTIDAAMAAIVLDDQTATVLAMAAGTKSAKQEVAARGVRAAVPWTTIEAALAGVGWSTR